MTAAITRQQRIMVPSRKVSAASKEITHESIAEHLTAFEGAGGEIEVLGNTSVFQHIGRPSKADDPEVK